MSALRVRFVALFAAVATFTAGAIPFMQQGVASAAAPVVSYTATVTIPVPPASHYAGSGGGDGWAVAMTPSSVYNVFHHQGSLQVACHKQSDASACWSPKTITDAGGGNFAVSGEPGLWIDQVNGHLYVYATSSNGTGGVVCVDTTKPANATGAQLFCGFTALTGAGQSYGAGISGISDPVTVGTKWYAFNYVNGVAPGGASGTTAQNRLLCFDQVTLKACTSQPFKVNLGASAVSVGSFPASNAIAAIGNQIIVPVANAVQSELGCFNAASGGACSGSWPAALTVAASGFGAPFAMLTTSGAVRGLCLPTTGNPCFALNGAHVATPAGMAAVVGSSTPWNGPALTLGPRVYVPNGNTNGSVGVVACYDYATNASCVNFPKTFNTLSYLYTVNADPQRPTCIWANADGGSQQIQNFDAYSGGACGQGDIRVLASSVVVNTPECVPGSWTSLQVLAPPRASYASGTVAFQDSDANPIPGTPTRALDGTGTAGLAGLNLQTPSGLPQFLITLHGATGNPGSVRVKLVWRGQYNPNCILTATNVGGLGDNGLMLLGADGGMFAFGNLGFLGAADLNGVPNAGGLVLTPYTAIAATGHSGAPGYLDVLRNGKVVPIGSARNVGDPSAVHLNAPIVAAAATPTANGYWLVGSDGGVFGYGDAHFHGSLGAMHLNAPIVAAFATANGGGYYLVASDGGVFAFGNAHFYGSLGALKLKAPITGAVRSRSGNGYYLVAADGGVFTFGDAHFHGSEAGRLLNAPMVAIAVDHSGNGYWLIGADGGVFAFGDAPNQGSLTQSAVRLRAPIVGGVN